jgi:hypothetical protein
MKTGIGPLKTYEQTKKIFMKKIIAAIAIVTGFAACSNPKTGDVTTTSKQLTTADTAGLAQFQQWKQQQEMLQSNAMYNGVNDFNNPASPNYQQAPVRERVIERVVEVPARTRSTARTTTRRSSGRSYGYSNGSVAQAPVPARKKGWSKAAKGAAIGGASGAVIGAVVSKKKGLGAVIGGVVGAAGGYAIGRGQDKRDGRY